MLHLDDHGWPSLNERAAALADDMVAKAAELGVSCTVGRLGNREIDCGVNAQGSVEAGLRLAEICLGGLGRVTLDEAPAQFPVSPVVVAQTNAPLLACLASQYAGWHFAGSAEGQAFSVLGSGPARALARREPIFQDITHRERAERAVLVLETDKTPAASIVADAAEGCGLKPEQITILCAPTRSTAGCVQVAARTVECAMQKARLLDFRLDRILSARGTAPLCAPNPDSAVAMGRTNDAIIYGGEVEFSVSGPAKDAKRLAEALPSCTSAEWGRSFAEIFRQHNGDFRSIEPGFFSPARVIVRVQGTNTVFEAGRMSPELLAEFLA